VQSLLESIKICLAWLLSNGGIIATAVGGVFVKLSEGKTSRLWKTLPFVGVVVGFVWALMSANFQDAKQRSDMEAAINRVDTYVSEQTKEGVAQDKKNFCDVIERVEINVLGVKPEVAKKFTCEEAASDVSASNAASASAQGISPDRRQLLTVWLFPHVRQDVNFALVRSRLFQIASKVEEHPVKQMEYQTNSVWYGGGATLPEAKAAALIVASAGIGVHQICNKTSVQVANLIQIGGSGAAARNPNLPALSAKQIQDLEKPLCASE
jgi:hypothetical protein